VVELSRSEEIKLPQPGENADGSKIFQEDIRRCQACDEEAQGRHAEERPVGPQGQEPQTGDRDRAFGSTRQRQESAEEGIQEENFQEENDKEAEEQQETEGEAVGSHFAAVRK
jgi:hypothetical protein